MTKKIAIICLIVLACCAIGTDGYLVIKKRGNSADGTNDEMQIFSNQDNSYVLKLDNYVKFRETTAISNVNNKDGLEVNYGDNYITIQRFEYTTYNDNFSEFIKFIESTNNLASFNLVKDSTKIDNPEVQQYEISYLSLVSGGKEFVGYLIYLKTDNGMYKMLISGSDKKLIEHYKMFVNDMEFK